MKAIQEAPEQRAFIRARPVVPRELSGITPLMRAIIDKKHDIVSTLLKNKADVHVTNSRGQDAIHLAYKDLRCAQLLVDAGADATKPDTRGMTALVYAARYGLVESVRFFMNCGTDLELRDSLGFTALTWAAASGHDRVVKILIEANASIDVRDGNQSTALMLAAQDGWTTVARVLLDAKADLCASNEDGATALMWAASAGHNAIVEMFLNAFKST